MLRALSILRWLSCLWRPSFLSAGWRNSAPSSTVYKHLFFCVFLFSTNLFLPQQWLQKQLRNETSGGVEIFRLGLSRGVSPPMRKLLVDQTSPHSFGAAAVESCGPWKCALPPHRFAEPAHCGHKPSRHGITPPPRARAQVQQGLAQPEHVARRGGFAVHFGRRFHGRRAGGGRQIFVVRLGKDIQYPRVSATTGRSAAVGSVQPLRCDVSRFM